jgi:alkylation response protein AidB-like acyl-CoA dehydrogenase
MAATGSRDIVARGVVVPLDRASSVAMGALEASADYLERILFGTTKKQSETSAAQIRLGKVAAQAAMAEQLLRAAASEMGACARGEIDLAPIDHVRLRTVISLVVRQCRDVVRDVMEASGAKAHFMDNELQRIHRDVHMVAAHTVFDVDGVANEYGRELLR